MLRNRSRAVTSKQALMADHTSSQSSSPTQKNYTKIPAFFGSPRFRAFTIKGHSEIDALISPTSILDTKPFPSATPFPYEKNRPTTPKAASGNKRLWEKQLEAKAIGLALIHTLNDETFEENSSKPNNNGKVLFGTKLRVQIPPFPPSTLSPTESPKSPADFKIKTRSSQLSAKGDANNSGIQTENSNSPQASITVSEMELSEDYTCVISRGPNPRTTRIFDNCIVESYYTLSDQSNSASANFLSFCFTCKKNLEQKNDIYIYRGEKAFCSRECRSQEMLLDEVGNTEFDEARRSCF